MTTKRPTSWMWETADHPFKNLTTPLIDNLHRVTLLVSLLNEALNYNCCRQRQIILKAEGLFMWNAAFSLKEQAAKQLLPQNRFSCGTDESERGTVTTLLPPLGDKMCYLRNKEDMATLHLHYNIPDLWRSQIFTSQWFITMVCSLD